MTLLNGDIRSLFGSVFGGIYDDGTLTRVSQTSDGVGGLTPSTATPVAVKVQVDACTEVQKLEDGWSQKDVRLLVLQDGVSPKPKNGDRIVAKSITYTLGPIVTEDPASSYAECRGAPL